MKEASFEELLEENRALKKKLKDIERISSSKINRRKKLLKFIGGTVAGKRLKDSIYTVINQYTTSKNVTKDALSDFLASLLSRIIRVGVITVLFAVLPSILLFQQNIILKKQNKKIDIQNQLTEANRRSAQMFVMSDVLSDINTELSTGKKTLSSPLVGRIISLSRSMKPYLYVKGDKLIDKPISPERGQLLISLCRSNLNANFFTDQILQESDFTQSELTDSNLFGKNLSDITLNNSNLENSDLVNVNFSKAWLKSCNLKNVDLTDANLNNANLENSNLSYAILNFVSWKNANLKNVILDGAIVEREDWIEHIKELDVKGAEEIASKYQLKVIDNSLKNKRYRLVKL